MNYIQKQEYQNPGLPIPTRSGLYDPKFEHDACGVGLVANIQGVPSHSVIRQGIEVLVNLGHRGAAGADPNTGDGAGIMLQMPHQFFSIEANKISISLPEVGKYGVGMIFLPMEIKAASKVEKLVEQVVKSEGQEFIGWRTVPVNPNAIGVLASRVQPLIKQFFIRLTDNLKSGYPFETKLFVIRRLIEKGIDGLSIPDKDNVYICSLSSNKIVYKGLVLADQIDKFYPDLTDPNLVSSFALVHSRFSTNTLGSWKLAHPYRHVIHNGEINTLRGNINWMSARESILSSSIMDDDLSRVLPLIDPDQSDTASLDNVVELLLASGRSLPHTMMMMIPEAWGDHIPMDQKRKDFYEYHSCLMEPWDGPALVIGTDGTKICAVLDRNGLRPCRYIITKDDLLVMASETGVLKIPEENIVSKWRIEPGRMFMLDTEEGRIIHDSEAKASICNDRPYGNWLKDNKVELKDLEEKYSQYTNDFSSLTLRQNIFGYTREEVNMLIEPMAREAKEAEGSMGNDTPLAVLSDEKPLLFAYFKQLFAQVSNPPLDAIREELVTSVETFIGRSENILDANPEHCRQLKLHEPILSNNELETIRQIGKKEFSTCTIPILFDINDGEDSLDKAVSRICDLASKAISDGATILILSDRNSDQNMCPIPSLLATSAIHHHLIRQGTRMNAGLVVETGEAREVSHFALLLGYGAAAINPYLAFETIAEMSINDTYSEITDEQVARSNFTKAVHKGIVKVMSKMGISTLQSYRGAQIFEAIGLDKSLIDIHFNGTISRIGGIKIRDIGIESIERHQNAYIHDHPENLSLQAGGQYQWRHNGEYHLWNPESIAKVQEATKLNNPKTFQEFTDYVDSENRRLSTIRGLLKFKNGNKPIPVDEVEPASEIVKRFATGAVSLGSISREAHETMAIAMNRIGARSNTGEGGEDPTRYKADSKGNSRNSAMKQIASGRFGVTSGYLASATDLQIKMAQGSKPGEGGRLPGHKVDEYIGWVRNSTPGVELISPPPHHDIYSIEDLAQLIHDLKNSNPESRIHVKLVSEAGVGTIAAGVAKGHGDVVLISGDSGGTGASPESSIKYAGLPWELGLAETQQVLVMNDLRSRIVVQTDGQLKTGRDVAIACLLGAEEFGFATAPLIIMGCIMLRKCHLNTCSVGIATQDPELRSKFSGQPEHIINYFFFIAEQLREYMSQLGFKTVNEMVGRKDKLDTKLAINHWKAKGLDFEGLLHQAEVPESVGKYNSQKQDHGIEDTLDRKLIELCNPALTKAEQVELDLEIGNGNRTTGTMLSYEVAKLYGDIGLPNDTIKINFNGSAGQSFAAFLNSGITFRLTGDANDYFCKGLSGGQIIISPPEKSIIVPEENVIIGNVALYGATDGKVFIRGIAGERFAVRNSGAIAVVEGVGDHGCEYMTRGKVIVLGSTGRNFAAGMSGGEAYVFDESNEFTAKCNLGMVDLESLSDPDDIESLKSLLHEHLEKTGSNNANRILSGWDHYSSKFIKVMPRDYKRILAVNKTAKANYNG